MEMRKEIFREKEKVFSEIIEGQGGQILKRETHVKIERRKLPEVAGDKL